MISTTVGKCILVSLAFLCLSFSGIAQKSGTRLEMPGSEKPEEVFFNASKAEILENYPEALLLYGKVVELDPKNATAYFKMADLYNRQNQFAEALPHARKAVELYKENQYFWLELAKTEESNQNWKQAIEALEQLMKRFPNSDFYERAIAQIYYRSGDYKKAIKALEKAEKQVGPSIEITQTLQSLYLKQNRLEKAIEIGKKCIVDLPNDPEPRYNFVQLLINNNKVEEAEAELLKIVELFPEFPLAHLKLAELYVAKKDLLKADLEIESAFRSSLLPIEDKINVVARYLRGMNSEEDLQKAEKLTDLIIKTHPEDARAMLIKGDILNKQNKKKEARDYYVKAVMKDKNNFSLWEQIVLIDLNLNELDSVIKHTNEAKTLFPNTPSFAFYNGLGNQMSKKYPEAAESLEQAKRISLDNREMQLEIYAQLGDVYHNLENKEKAFQSYDEVLRLDSGNAHVLNNYAYFLSLDKSKLDKALKMSTKLVALYPEDATYLDTHGWVLYEKKDFTEARIYLEKAAKASNSGVIWEHYGDVLFQLGKTNEALEAWKKAKDLGGELTKFIDKKLKDKKLYE